MIIAEAIGKLDVAANTSQSPDMQPWLCACIQNGVLAARYHVESDPGRLASEAHEREGVSSPRGRGGGGSVEGEARRGRGILRGADLQWHALRACLRSGHRSGAGHLDAAHSYMQAQLVWLAVRHRTGWTGLDRIGKTGDQQHQQKRYTG